MRIKHVNADPVFTRGTIAVDIPSKERLLEMFANQEMSTYLAVGAAFLHPKDQFNKKIGTARAESYALAEDPKYCLLKSIEPREERWVYHFTTVVPDARPNMPMYISVDFGVSISKLSVTSRLEYALFKE